MRRWIIGALSLALLLFAQPADAKKPKGPFKLLLTPGTQWNLVKIVQEPGKAEKRVDEVWEVFAAEDFGGGAIQVLIVATELDGKYERDRQMEFIISGTRFYDISWLEYTRPTPEVSASTLGDFLALFDTKKAGKKPVFTRYKDNPMAFVRYEKLSSFKAADGKTYKGVYHAHRDRGETETTDQWWYSAKLGIIQLEMSVPPVGGGGKMTWIRK